MAADPSLLPYLSAELPGTGGVLSREGTDFRVEELPAYEPSGDGDHVFATVQKRGLTTPEAARRLAEALGVPANDVGWAGMKDRHALTIQRLSFPPPCTPEAVSAVDVPDIEVRDVTRHNHKLRTGHLRGNRFTLIIGDTECNADEAAARAEAICAHIAKGPGWANWFGGQRFGATGSNAEIGHALITGEGLRGRPPRGRKKRMFVSAYQSSLFNEFLRRRIEDGLFATVLDGDMLAKTTSGGIFASTETATDQARLDSGEVVPTGPMYGHKLTSPPQGSDASKRENSLLDEQGLSLSSFKRVGKLAAGTRRRLAVMLGDVAVHPAGDKAIEVTFELPSGSYATAVMREVVKGTANFPR
jgi:tRNA pseudouridine13 synthase